MFMLSKRKVIILVLVLLALAAASHLFFRFSPVYSSAVSAYEEQHTSTADTGFSLCFSCAKRISYGNGIWHYRFTLLVENGESTQKVKVHNQSKTGTSGYAVIFE